MKRHRTLAMALLPLWALSSCGKNDPPTDAPCQGLIAVAILPAAQATSAKSIEVTDIGPDGARFVQSEVPPLSLPNVVLKERNQYQPGLHSIRIVVGDSVPSQADGDAPAAVSWVGRVTANLTESCPAVSPTMHATTLLDVCMDKCDADVRCGARALSELNPCIAECQQLAPDFAATQNDWKAMYKNATTMVQQLEGCNHVACGAVESCGAAVQESGEPLP